MSLNTIFQSIFRSNSVMDISISGFFYSLITALLIGLFLAYTHTIRTRYTRSFLITLATLPSVVAVIIMMVNGNLGTGVAVAGAFSLIRFRSVPGSARDISAIFLGMGAGLAAGMGYIAFAICLTVIIQGVTVLYNISNFGRKGSKERTLKITIPENLDYTTVFDDIFQKYTSKAELVDVKTDAMGSLFKLSYDIFLIDTLQEKNMLDELRCRNGNLEISSSKHIGVAQEL